MPGFDIVVSRTGNVAYSLRRCSYFDLFFFPFGILGGDVFNFDLCNFEKARTLKKSIQHGCNLVFRYIVRKTVNPKKTTPTSYSVKIIAAILSVVLMHRSGVSIF